MATINQHAPGSFCWIELATSDQNAGKQFYADLMGWTITDNPMGEAGTYTMFELGGRSTGGAYTLMADEAALGIPPHWNLYVSVTSADETAARAAGLGGKVLVGPFDVMTHGRMAVLQDPTGAVINLWEPKEHHGVCVAGEAGALCWADLSSPDQAAATAFYTGLFGYEMVPGDGGYLHIQNGETMIGGVQSADMRNPHVPAHWLIYLQVDDCDASTAKAQSMGAQVHFGPITLDKVGRFSVLADPQGAVFALFQPAE